MMFITPLVTAVFFITKSQDSLSHNFYIVVDF